MTVEFWFKASFKSGTTQYLMTLFNKESSQQYFSVFYDATDILLCAPFGMKSPSSPYLNFNLDFA